MNLTGKLGAAFGGAAAVCGAAAAATGWNIARRLTAPVGSRRFSLALRGVERDWDRLWVLLDSTKDTASSGTFNLWFERGGWLQLDECAEARGASLIARPVRKVSAGLTPRVGDRVSWSGIYYATPEDAGLDVREINILTPAGYAPAWRIDGDASTWAIHIHGLGSPRAGTLRGVQVANELGLTSLVVSYRNDGEGPCVGTGRSTLGVLEAADAEAALGYAVRSGAERIVLFGWSMGGTIALRLASRSDYAPSIAGLVLDSPVLDWIETIRANCERAGLPPVAARFALPWLTREPLAQVIGLPEPATITTTACSGWASEIEVPALILHGTLDDSVLVEASRAVSELKPEQVKLVAFDAGHTLSWNSDPERWRQTVIDWLGCHVLP